MKAITIWQPWASLIATGEKVYETRGWPTKYRGSIAIHAALKDVLRLPITPELEKYALHNDKIGPWIWLPHGKIIAIGELVNCWRIVYHPGPDADEAKHIPIGAESMVDKKHEPGFGDYIVPDEKELALGNWDPEDGRNGMRYAWEIRNVKLLENPVPIRGRQGLWNWDEVIPEPVDDLPFPEVLP